VHNDPADRMLIAAAQLNNVPLVTADRLIVEYASNHPGTPVVDARLVSG
jgi:PIN domain nuclease of toxin-antitoxin system